MHIIWFHLPAPAVPVCLRRFCVKCCATRSDYLEISKCGCFWKCTYAYTLSHTSAHTHRCLLTRLTLLVEPVVAAVPVCVRETEIFIEFCRV